MWSLGNLLCLCIALSCVSRAAGVIHVSGYKGGEVKVSCSYGEGYESYEKYLCKNDCGNDDVLITTTETKKNRYSIYDDQTKRVFIATISHLRREDAGKYWCGVSRSVKDIYTEVKLEVGQEWCCVKSIKKDGIEGRPLTFQCPFPPQHSNNRTFLCKGDHRNNCTNMMTSQRRFTLQHDVSSSSFSVTITELKAGDAAKYWCGSDSQWSPGDYTKIQLSVVFPQQTSTVTSPFTVESAGSQSTGVPGTHIKDVTHIIAVALSVPAVLLILAFAVVIVYKCKVNEPEVSSNRNITKTNEVGEITGVTSIYENEDVACSNMRAVKQQSMSHCDNAGEDHQDFVYENFTAPEDIYCNQFNTSYRN